jgi:hypothetical protein
MYVQRRHEDAHLNGLPFDVLLLVEILDLHDNAVGGRDDEVVSLRGDAIGIAEEIEGEDEKEKENENEAELDNLPLDKEPGRH